MVPLPRVSMGISQARPRWAQRIFLCCAFAVALAACRRPAPAPARLNLIVILADALRADRLDLYGYYRPTAPHLTQRAQSGIVLRSARSQAGCTYPSVSSIFTSRWPQHFLNRQDTYGMAIPPDTPTLAETLRAHGYATAAVSSSSIVRATPSSINFQGGFGRGFGTFDESCLERAAPCVNEQAEIALAQLHEPFFLYLHYLEPHAPYRPPSWHEPRFALDRPEKQWVRRGEPATIFHRLYDGDPSATFDASDIRHMSDLYDEQIGFLDEQLDLLFADLQKKGLLERSLVVFLSDHGEELLDHGNFGHCRDLAYETILRTPFVLWIPGQAAGMRDATAFNLDLMPTVLDYLGVPYDAGAFAGRTLRPTIESNRAVHDVAAAAQGSSRVLTDGRYKVWLNLAGGPLRAYDLRVGESEPLPGDGGPSIRRLRTELFRWLAEQEGGPTADSLRHAREVEAQLRALGYL
jgi:arylsulfatase